MEEVPFKPCPFCGSDHCTVMSGWVECLICGCRGPHGKEPVDRLRAWSIRNAPQNNPKGNVP